MRSLLTHELRIWHLLLLVPLIALASGSAVVAARPGPDRTGDGVTAPVADAFFPQGTFNMAAASSRTVQTVHSVDGEVEVLRTSFTIPAGQKADIAAFFNAEGYKYPNGYCYLKFKLDNSGYALLPGKVWVADGYVYKGAYPTISAQGYKVGLQSGDHVLIVTLATTGGDCYVDDRSLIVFSNRHS